MGFGQYFRTSPVLVQVANCSGTFGPQGHGEEHPGGRFTVYQLGGKVGLNPTQRVAERGAAAQGAHGIAGARQKRQWQSIGNIGPVVPAMQIGETVGSHDPDKIRLAHRVAKGLQGLGSVVGIYLVFNIGHHEAGVFGNLFGESQPFGIVAGFMGVFQRVLG